jgi:hypothetical protein
MSTKSFLFVFISCIVFSLHAQKYSNSPFSAQGIGETENVLNPTLGALGNTQSAIIDSTTLNYYNPSSYASLGDGQPIFSVGLSVNSSKFYQSGLTSQQSLIGINHFAFGLSFAKRFGFCFGVRPYSSKGYEISSNSIALGDTVVNAYEGSGSYSNLFTGLSFKFINKDKHKFSIGTNASYLFGKMFDQQTTHLYSESIGGIQRTSLKINGYKFDFGANYQWLPTKSSVLTLAGTYSPKKHVAAESVSALIAATDFSNELSYDTLNYSALSTDLQLPSFYQLGFKYDFINNAANKHLFDATYHLILTGQFELVNWTQYKGVYKEAGLLNSNRYSVGLQFTPHFDFFDRSKNVSWFSKVRYRVGFQYATLPWQMDNKQLFNKSITFGLGLPIVLQKSLSSFNVGCVLGEKTNNINTSLKEEFFNVTVGVTITPAIYERWFRKGKID